MPHNDARPAARTLARTATSWSRLALVLALLAATLLAAVPTRAEAYSMKAPSGLKVTVHTLVSEPATTLKVCASAGNDCDLAEPASFARHCLTPSPTQRPRSKLDCRAPVLRRPD